MTDGSDSRGHFAATPADSGAKAQALQDVLASLMLEQRAPDSFIGRSASRSLPFVFGGQVAAQALSAAYRTVPPHVRVHSLHAYFVRAGDPVHDLEFEVTRIRDGRSFKVRSVIVAQGGEPVFSCTVSFSTDRPGFEHAEKPGSAIDLEPSLLRSRSSWLDEHAGHIPEWWSGPMAIDVRFTAAPAQLPRRLRPTRAQDLWMRADGSVPDDQRVHDCLLAFASDLTLLDPVVLAHGRSWYLDDLKAASLDHAMWFHRPVRVDDWLLYQQTSPIASGGRGFATGRIFDRRGALVASVAQEGLVALSAQSRAAGRASR
jgi:acyl-CoA thioesterase-2